jgi:undecaprenyl-diphosphatase
MKEKINRRILVTLIVLAILGIVLSIYSWRVPRAPFDIPVTLWFQAFDRPVLRSGMIWVSWIFSSWRMGIIVIVGMIVIWRNWGRLEAACLAIAGIATTIQFAIKEAVDRPRPSADPVQIFSIETSEGYPSGHAFTSIMVFGFLLYLILTHTHNRGWKILSAIFFTLPVLLVGASRIYLGVHWTSDVLGGYIIGAFFLTVIIWVYEREKEHPGRR